MTQRITVSISDETSRLVEEVTSQLGLKVSPWVDRVLRREAVRQGAGPAQASDADLAAQALGDIAIAAAADRHDQQQRRAG